MTFTVSVRSTLLAAAATLVTTLAQAAPSQVLSFGDSLAGTGNVTLRAPGSSATFEGRLNAATGSTNTARLQVDDAAALHRWGLATLAQLDRLLPLRPGKLLVIGDLMHGAALQAGHPEICATYDMDKENAIKSRKTYLQYARENGLVMAGMHLPVPAFMK